MDDAITDLHIHPSPATLAPTAAIDSDHPAVQACARQHAVGQDNRLPPKPAGVQHER